jgi:hypothetical protein
MRKYSAMSWCYCIIAAGNVSLVYYALLHRRVLHVWCSLLTELVGQSVLSTVVCTCMLLLTQHCVHNTGNLHNMSSLHYNATQSSMAGGSSTSMFNTLNMQQTPPFVSTSRGGGAGGIREGAPPLGRLRYTFIHMHFIVNAICFRCLHYILVSQLHAPTSTTSLRSVESVAAVTVASEYVGGQTCMALRQSGSCSDNAMLHQVQQVSR